MTMLKILLISMNALSFFVIAPFLILSFIDEFLPFGKGKYLETFLRKCKVPKKIDMAIFIFAFGIWLLSIFLLKGIL